MAINWKPASPEEVARRKAAENTTPTPKKAPRSRKARQGKGDE